MYFYRRKSGAVPGEKENKNQECKEKPGTPLRSHACEASIITKITDFPQPECYRGIKVQPEKKYYCGLGAPLCKSSELLSLFISSVNITTKKVVCVSNVNVFLFPWDCS